VNKALLRLVFLPVALVLLQPPVHAAPTPELSQCIAIRGNGGRVVSTFAALARFSDHYGVVDGMIGSSSGSIAAFLYESMTLNPYVRDCANGPCPPDVLGRRMGLMLKSLLGYSEFLLATQSGERVQTLFREGPSPGALLSAFTDPNLRGLIRWCSVFPSPRVLFYPKQHFARIKDAATALDISPDDGALFLIRNGLIDTREVVEVIGRAADFYAGRGSSPEAHWRAFFDQCTPEKPGHTWEKIGARPHRSNEGVSACKEAFQGLLAAHRAAYFKHLRGEKKRISRPWGKVRRGVYDNKPRFARRLDDKVGDHLPTLIGSSAFVGDPTFRSFRTTKRAYDLFETRAVPALHWLDEFRIGYFGDAGLAQRIVDNPSGFADMKSKRAIHLGDEAWSTALFASITEPGIGPAQIYDADTKVLTAGGWVDNHATLALRNLGCEQVVYIHRRGPDSAYAQTVARGAGFDDRHLEDFFDLENPASAYAVSLANADAIWCTDWSSHALGMSHVDDLANDGFTAPLWVKTPSSSFLQGKNAYPKASTRHRVAGCYSE